MKVDEPKPLQRTAPASRQTKAVTPSEHSQRPDEELLPQIDDQEQEQAELPDISAFHDVGDEDLTPPARQAMMELVTEVAKLRQEITRNRRRITYLTELADQDSLAPVFNRRAFVRELAHAQFLVKEFQSDNTLVFLVVENLQAINHEHGHGAGDAAVEHAGDVILRQIGDSDVVGRLGGAEFAVVLIGEHGEAAETRARALAKAIENQKLHWHGVEIALEVGLALHPLDIEEDAGEALDSADRDNRLTGPAAGEPTG